jgi:hypothetical protein
LKAKNVFKVTLCTVSISERFIIKSGFGEQKFTVEQKSYVEQKSFSEQKSFRVQKSSRDKSPLGTKVQRTKVLLVNKSQGNKSLGNKNLVNKSLGNKSLENKILGDESPSAMIVILTPTLHSTI